MGIHISLENGSGDILLESGFFMLLEDDWLNEPGNAINNWTKTDGGNQSWTPVDGGSQIWTPETGD